MWVALLSGALAGSALFILQRWTVEPLIQAAEVYETEAHPSEQGSPHEDEGWQPSSPFQRNIFTALATILTSIGFAAVLFGIVSLSGQPLFVGQGAIWGLAGFACFSLAPALGLPPVPPGVAVADLKARQLWWIATAVATAIGLWLVASRRRNWLLRIGGVASLLLPHVIGAPVATGQSVVPARLIRQFTIASLANQAMFWVLLGTTGGFLYTRLARRSGERES